MSRAMASWPSNVNSALRWPSMIPRAVPAFGSTSNSVSASTAKSFTRSVDGCVLAAKWMVEPSEAVAVKDVFWPVTRHGAVVMKVTSNWSPWPDHFTSVRRTKAISSRTSGRLVFHSFSAARISRPSLWVRSCDWESTSMLSGAGEMMQRHMGKAGIVRADGVGLDDHAVVAVGNRCVLAAEPVNFVNGRVEFERDFVLVFCLAADAVYDNPGDRLAYEEHLPGMALHVGDRRQAETALLALQVVAAGVKSGPVGAARAVFIRPFVDALGEVKVRAGVPAALDRLAVAVGQERGLGADVVDVAEVHVLRAAVHINRLRGEQVATAGRAA